MFSNESRWDRHLPHQERCDEAISVGAVFQGGRVYPKFFIWRYNRYSVDKVDYRWEERRGAGFLHFFTVTAQSNIYQIYFNSVKMHWRLNKVGALDG